MKTDEIHVKMKQGGRLERDNAGAIRFSDDVRVTEQQAKEIVEQVYLKAKVNLEFKQLAGTFAEEGGGKGVHPKSSKKWTIEDRRIVLQSVGESNEGVGLKLGRSGMSIHMQRSGLLAAFDAWKFNAGIDGTLPKTREEQIDEFLKVY
jgi:hypothetical protein